MKIKNPIIRHTNHLLFGIFTGWLLAWTLGNLGNRHLPVDGVSSRSVDLAGDTTVPKNLENSPLSSGSIDTDNDGIPDSWELANGLDPGDSEDYLSDFDLDGLTALHEFQQGTNPLGNWTEVAIDLGSRIKLDSQSYKKLTDSGYLLAAGNANFPAFSGERVGVLWHKETGAVEISYEDDDIEGDYRIFPWDVNNYGEVVGGAVPLAGGDQVPFLWSKEGGFSFLSPPPSMTGIVLGYRINDWGHVLLQAPNGSPIVSAVIDSLGILITKVPEVVGDLDEPRILEVNNFGEMLGVYLSPADGKPKAFLRIPGFADFDTTLAASYPALFGQITDANEFTAEMNDFGEFGFDFVGQGPNWNPDIEFYFFDGDYRSFKTSTDDDVNLLSLNEKPQILFKAQVPLPNTQSSFLSEYRLASGGQIATLDLASPESEGTDPRHFSLINNETEILGYRRTGYNYKHEPFLLQLDQDADNDGLPDDWEVFYGFDPNSPSDATDDFDNDGLSNLAEFRLDRNPNVIELPSSQTGNMPDLRPGIDTDGDGMPNVWEIQYGLNWEDASDAERDLDRDGYKNLDEFLLGTTPAGAPSFEAHILETSNGLPVSDPLFISDGSILGWANVQGYGQVGYGWSPNEVGKWYYPTTGYGTSRLLCANQLYVGGYEKFFNHSAEFPGLWNRESGDFEWVVNSTGIYFETSRIVALNRVGSSGVVSFSRSPSPNNKELALMRNGDISAILTFQDSLGQTAETVYSNSVKLHDSGAGVAYAKFPGSKYKVVTWDDGLVPQTAVYETERYNPRPIISQQDDVLMAWPVGSNATAAVSILQGGQITSVTHPDVTSFDLREVSIDGGIIGVAKLNIGGSSKYKPMVIREELGGTWGIHFFETEEAQSIQYSLANQYSEVVGSFYEDGQNHFRYWRGLGAHYDLESLISISTGNLSLAGFLSIASNGSILCDGDFDSRYRRILLTPVSDTDGDGASDQWEVAHNFDPFDAGDGLLDADSDQLTNSDEFKNQTDPHRADSDQDTMADGWEVAWGFDPLVAADAYADPDRDQVQNRFEHALDTAPTGIYRYESLEGLGFDPDYSLNLQGSFRDPIDPFVVVRGKRGGVLGTFIVHTQTEVVEEIPQLAVGKMVTIREVGNSGACYGTATNADNRTVTVRFVAGALSLDVVPVPTSGTNPYVHMIDVSADERSLLARYRSPDGVIQTGVFTIQDPGSGPGSSTIAGDSVFSLSFGPIETNLSDLTSYSYFSPEICVGPIEVIGSLVQQFYVPTYWQETSIVSQRSGEIGFTVLAESADIDSGAGDFNSDVYEYGYILHSSKSEQELTYISEGWGASTNEGFIRMFAVNLETLNIDTYQTPGPLWFSVEDTDFQSNALVKAMGDSYLLSPGHSLKIGALRVRASETTPDDPDDPASLPRVSDVVTGGTGGAQLLDRDGQISGFSSNQTESFLWFLSEANDFDSDGINDDLERVQSELKAAYLH